MRGGPAPSHPSRFRSTWASTLLAMTAIGILLLFNPSSAKTNWSSSLASPKIQISPCGWYLNIIQTFFAPESLPKQFLLLSPNITESRKRKERGWPHPQNSPKWIFNLDHVFSIIGMCYQAIFFHQIWILLKTKIIRFFENSYYLILANQTWLEKHSKYSSRI